MRHRLHMDLDVQKSPRSESDSPVCRLSDLARRLKVLHVSLSTRGLVGTQPTEQLVLFESSLKVCGIRANDFDSAMAAFSMRPSQLVFGWPGKRAVLDILAIPTKIYTAEVSNP